MTTIPTSAPQSTSAGSEPIPDRYLYGVMAEFTTPAQIMKAAEKIRDAGYRWWDCHTPFPVHGLDKAMGIKPTILPILAFFGGLTGAVLGLILEVFTNSTGFDFWLIVPVRGYEFLISGKPMHSYPAFIPVIFELTILMAASAVFFGMLIFNKLPTFYHPVFKSRRFARVTDDRFFLVIESRDPKFSRRKTRALLEELDPVSMEELES